MPSEWKYAKVTPLYRKEMSTDMDNYCPISVLPVVSNVLDRVVQHQLHSFLRKHKLLSNFQCDFRRNNSTEFAAIVFSDCIRRGRTLDCSLGQYLLTCARLTMLITKYLFPNYSHMDLRTFRLIVSAHLNCVRKLTCHGVKDVRANCFCASLLRMQIHMRVR